MVEVRVYVEGGGDTVAQAAPLRKALQTWIDRALGDRRPRVRVIACGPRRRAFERFREDLEQRPEAFCLLLVDSEEQVRANSRWEHVRGREGDRWSRPEKATEAHLHFMAQVMETWLLADRTALRGYFGAGFVERHLPGHPDLEILTKQDIYRRLGDATRPSTRGEYVKGRDLALLGVVDPAEVRRRCRHAQQFVEAVENAEKG